MTALGLYSWAADNDPNNPIPFLNRSASNLKLGRCVSSSNVVRTRRPDTFKYMKRLRSEGKLDHDGGGLKAVSHVCAESESKSLKATIDRFQDFDC